MNIRIGSVIGWLCAGLVGAFNIMATVMKFVPPSALGPEMQAQAEAMAQRLGTGGLEHGLGVIEGIITILYLVPRTSTVGFVLMVGYLGGALATNLTHGFSHAEALPIYILFVLMTIGAYFRNPELLSRLLGRPVPSKVGA